MINLRYWAARPAQIPARLRYWLWELRNPDKPWLCPATVEFCDQNLDRTAIGLEFGSGRGTVWFARRLVGLTSVEHHAGWYDRVRTRLARSNLARVDLRLIPLDREATGPEIESFHAGSLPRYAAVADEFPDESLGLVVVDGPYRLSCIGRSLAKLKPGGLLLLDDRERWPDRSAIPVPADWPVVHLASNGLKQTCIWRKP